MKPERQKLSLVDRVQKSLERAVAILEAAASNLERLTDAVLQAFLQYLDRTYQWLVKAVKYVKEYLIRAGKALGRLVLVEFKLFLFYLPGVICLLIYFPSKWSILLIIGCVWILLITALVITSRGKKSVANNGVHRIGEPPGGSPTGDP